MNKPFRNFLCFLGLLAAVAVFMSARNRSRGAISAEEKTAMNSNAGTQEDIRHGGPDTALGEHPTSQDAPLQTRVLSRERPDEAERTRLRLERRKAELQEQLEQLKAGGFGHAHPNVLKIQQELENLEADSQ